MPLDLDAVRRGELSQQDMEALIHYARPAVRHVIPSSPEAEIEDVLSKALIQFWRRRPSCHTEQHALNLFKWIAYCRAVDHVRREARRVTEPWDDQIPKPLPAADTETVERLRAELLEKLGLPDATSHEEYLQILIEGAGLNALQEALLREHIIGGVPQRTFAEGHGLPSGSIGRIKDETLDRLRRFLGTDPPRHSDRESEATWLDSRNT